jgi:hypothetical protein
MRASIAMLEIAINARDAQQKAPGGANAARRR